MRRAILHGLIAAAATTVLGVEALSVFGLVRQLPLLLLGVVSVLVFGLVLRRRSRGTGPIVWSAPAHPVLLGGLIFIGGTTLLVALVAAPNSWDAMTYHMARVAQWYDHGTVEHYYTVIDRQLWQPPFGGFLVLLGYGGLGGRDYLANLPQWIAGVGGVLVAMEIAGLLGASRRSRYLIALFTATAPAIILQSSSTLTDLLGGFWLACAAWLALTQYLAPGFAPRDALWIGVALGLAIGTKGTSIPLGLPWALLFLIPTLRPFNPRAALGQAALIGLAVLVLGGGHFIRNLAVFETPLGPEAVQRMLRPASLGAPTLLSNLVAHLTLELQTPWNGVNEMLRHAVAWLHAKLSLDLAILYPYFGGFRVFGWTSSEDLAGNLVQSVFGMMALAWLLLSFRRVSKPERLMAGAFLMGALLLVLTVRWQPFIARLHIPLLLLLPPCLLVPFDRRWPRATSTALIAAALFALPPLLLHSSRPILSAGLIGWNDIPARSIFIEPRAAQYFVSRPELYQPYRRAVDALAQLGCHRVGLVAGYDSWEYPLWALGRSAELAFTHLPPHAGSGRSGTATGVPCALVGLDQPAGWRPSHLSAQTRPVLAEGPVTLWR